VASALEYWYFRVCTQKEIYLYSLYAEFYDSKAAEESSMSLLESGDDRVK